MAAPDGADIFKLVQDKDPKPLREVLQRDFPDVPQHKKLLSLRNERQMGPLAFAIVKNRPDSFVSLCRHLNNNATIIEPRFDPKPKPKEDEKNNLFFTAIRYYNHGGDSMARYILQHVTAESAFIRYEPQRRCALHEAADKGYAAVFEVLAKEAPSLAPRFFATEDYMGRNPLHFAAQKGHSDVVRILIRMVPKLELKKDDSHENALWKAVRMGRKEVVGLLLEHRPHLVRSRSTPIATRTKPRGRSGKSAHKSEMGKSVYQFACEVAKSRPVIPIVDGGGGLQRSSTYDSSIQVLLKEYILRLEASSREKRELLTKEERGKEIYLDLSLFNGFHPKEDRFSIYLDSLEDLKIDFLDCLEFVKLPNLSCERGGSCKASPSGHRLDSEARKVFEFLGRNEVERALKVVVPDCPRHPHTSSDIAICLDGLDLKTLDWRRLDLDLNVILKIAPYLEKISLYSSGNQDVLKLWCGFEGLVHFEYLKEVSIFIYTGEHSEAELQQLQAGVLSRLQSHKQHTDHPMYLKAGFSDDFGPEVVAIPCECTQPRFTKVEVTTLSWEAEPKASAQNLPLMGGMRHQETFFDKVRPIKEFLKLFHSSERPDCVYARQRPVKVAIIDSGIAPNLDLDLYHVRGGKSFVEDAGSGTADSHWHIVSNYHGSQLAQIVAATNPFCDIYAAKVYHGNARGGVDEDAAIAAINWARQQGVDVIVMSWTVPDASAKAVGKLHNRFRRTLHSASEKCLLFASTRDGASTNVVPFPASHSNVFAISSCPMDGRITHDIAKSDNTRYYYLPGENFHLHVPKYLVSEGIKIDSGSSLATAAAAATASLILTCARFAFYEEPAESPDGYPRSASQSPEIGYQVDGGDSSDGDVDLSDMKKELAKVEGDMSAMEKDLTRRFGSSSDSEDDSDDNSDEDGSQDRSTRGDDESRTVSTASSPVGSPRGWPDVVESNNAMAEKAFESLRTEESMRAAFKDFSDEDRRVKIWDFIGPDYAMMPMSDAKDKLKDLLKMFVG